LDNGYPLDLIFSSIGRRLQTRSHTNSLKSNKQKEKLSYLYFTIPYVSCISKKFIQFFKNISFNKLAFSCNNKLNKFIKIHKDVLSSSSRTNMVYQINCLNCDASYVSQTKRTLNTRVCEHRNHTKKNSIQNLFITDYELKFRHEFDWDNMKILDEEMNYKNVLSLRWFLLKNKNKVWTHRWIPRY